MQTYLVFCVYMTFYCMFFISSIKVFYLAMQKVYSAHVSLSGIATDNLNWDSVVLKEFGNI